MYIDPDMQKALESAMRGQPTLVQHFKGGRYVLEGVAFDCDDLDRKLVIYTNISTKTRFVRPIEQFFDLKHSIDEPDKLVPRFTVLL